MSVLRPSNSGTTASKLGHPDARHLHERWFFLGIAVDSRDCVFGFCEDPFSGGGVQCSRRVKILVVPAALPINLTSSTGFHAKSKDEWTGLVRAFAR
jgi:hypothetical protein